MNATFDHAAFVEALTAAREAQGISWRQVASVGASSRRRCNASWPAQSRCISRATPVGWLCMPADAFIRRSRGRVDVVLGNWGAGNGGQDRSRAGPHRGQLRHMRRAIEEVSSSHWMPDNEADALRERPPVRIAPEPARWPVSVSAACTPLASPFFEKVVAGCAHRVGDVSDADDVRHHQHIYPLCPQQYRQVWRGGPVPTPWRINQNRDA